MSRTNATTKDGTSLQLDRKLSHATGGREEGSTALSSRASTVRKYRTKVSGDFTNDTTSNNEAPAAPNFASPKHRLQNTTQSSVDLSSGKIATVTGKWDQARAVQTRYHRLRASKRNEIEAGGHDNDNDDSDDDNNGDENEDENDNNENEGAKKEIYEEDNPRRRVEEGAAPVISISSAASTRDSSRPARSRNRNARLAKNKASLSQDESLPRQTNRTSIGSTTTLGNSAASNPEGTFASSAAAEEGDQDDFVDNVLQGDEAENEKILTPSKSITSTTATATAMGARVPAETPTAFAEPMAGDGHDDKVAESMDLESDEYVVAKKMGSENVPSEQGKTRSSRLVVAVAVIFVILLVVGVGTFLAILFMEKPSSPTQSSSSPTSAPSEAHSSSESGGGIRFRLQPTPEPTLRPSFSESCTLCFGGEEPTSPNSPVDAFESCQELEARIQTEVSMEECLCYRYQFLGHDKCGCQSLPVSENYPCADVPPSVNLDILGVVLAPVNPPTGEGGNRGESPGSPTGAGGGSGGPPTGNVGGGGGSGSIGGQPPGPPTGGGGGGGGAGAPSISPALTKVPTRNVCSLCANGAPSPTMFSGTVAVDGSPEYTCTELDHLLPSVYVGDDLCYTFQLVGTIRCGCGTPHPEADCWICPSGSVPPAYNLDLVVGRNAQTGENITCFDQAVAIAEIRDDNECEAVTADLSEVCGCPP